MKKIQVSHLSFGYHKENRVIHDASFSIEEGSYTTIIGHNGSGKSTIAKLMIGLFRIPIISLSAQALLMILPSAWRIIVCRANKCRA